MKPPQSQSDSESRKKPGKQPGAKGGAKPDGHAAEGGAHSDERAAQGGVPPDKHPTQSGAVPDGGVGAQGGVHLDEQADAQGRPRPQGEAGERITDQPRPEGPAAIHHGPREPVAARSRADLSGRGGWQPSRYPIRVAGRVPGGLPGRRAGADLGWVRWGLMVPVVGLTAWAAAGILTHGLNGSWRSKESFYRIEPGTASGAGTGHTGGAHTGDGAGVGSSETQGHEPAWKNPATWTDSFGDGTPDFLRLTDSADQEAFRQWFAQIAEYQAMRPAAQAPKEITDCASLLRYAYREALKKHDAGWFKDTGMGGGSLPGEIQAWHYSDTPLGAGLFRITPGPFVQGDESDGAFAQFADAKTLVERNAYLVGRNVWQAEPGDLLFYRQFGESSLWQSMIVTRVGSGAAVVYYAGEDQSSHGTGPVPGDPSQSPHGRGPVRGDPNLGAGGELRRVELTELLADPEAERRPLASNPNFMGVYRWNILRGSL